MLSREKREGTDAKGEKGGRENGSGRKQTRSEVNQHCMSEFARSFK